MRLGIDASAEELPLDVGVPVVLDLVVRPPGQSPSYQRPPADTKQASIGLPSHPPIMNRRTERKKATRLLVSQQAMEFDDELIFLLREIAALEIRPKVVYPPEPAALATSQQPYTRTETKKLSIPGRTHRMKLISRGREPAALGRDLQQPSP